MDEAMVNWAITAVDHQDDTSRAEAWFAAFQAAYQEPETAGAYAEFAERLVANATAAGVDESVVREFAENLERYSSSPLDDVVAPMVEQRDNLVSWYVALRADAAGAVETADAEVVEDPWYWEESTEEWSYLENGEWVPQRSWDGQQWLVLNQDKTEWVPQRSWDGERWWVLNAERTEWVLAPGQEPVAVPEPEPVPEAAPEPEPVPQAVPEPEPVPQAVLEPEPVPQAVPEPEAQPEPVSAAVAPEPEADAAEPLAPAEALVANEVVATSLEEAMSEVDGIEDLSEEEIQEVMARVLANELNVS